MQRLLALICLFLWCSCGKKEVASKIILNSIPSPTTADLMDVVFLDSLHGYAVGGNNYDNTTILVTHDGGNSWLEESIPNTQNKIIFQIHQVLDKLMAVGLDGKTYIKYPYTDGWQIYQNIWWERMKDFEMLSNNEGIAVVGRNWNDGRIYKIDSLGNVLHRDSFNIEFNDVELTSSGRILVSGYGTIMYSDDDGNSWNYSDAQGDHFVKLKAFGNHVKALGYQGSILESEDGGSTWRKHGNGSTTYFRKYQFNDFLWLNEWHGIAVGNNGKVMITNDGGQHWQFNHDRNTPVNLYCIEKVTDRYAIIMGEKGHIFTMEINIFN